MIRLESYVRCEARLGRMVRWGAYCAFGAVLCLGLAAQPAFAQTGTIEGQVTSVSTGQPISAVQVSIIGTDIGTTTGLDGRFVLLNVPAGQHTIRAVAIGFKVGTLQLTVQSGLMTTADLALTRSVLQLDAVVVTGTAGQARVREVGNTVGQIDVAQGVKDPPANIDQLLQSRVTGLNVMQGNGMAGGGAQIRLRGAVSVNQSNQPIVYIDGVRVRSEGYARNGPPSSIDFNGRSGNVEASPLNDINAADIERIEVIKGSAASTLYGTEAAAGVIQIFTKRGSSGAPRWNLQVNQGFARTLPYGTDDDPYLRLKSPNGEGYCPDVVAAALVTFEETGTLPSLPAAPADGACSWLRNGYRQKYSGNISGGVDQFQYFVSGSWEDNDATLPLDNEQKFVTRGNFSFDIMDNLRFDWNTSYTNMDVRNTPAGNNAQGLTLNVFRAERNYRQSGNPIVLDSLLNQEITTAINRLITGGTVNYSPWPWFTNRFTLGYDLAQQENRNNRPFGFVSLPRGRLFDEQIQFTTLTADYVGNLDYTLREGILGTFSFGGQSITTEQIRTFAFGDRFAGPGEATVSNAASFISQEDRLRVVNAGFFFQNTFKLRDRYFITGGVRVDGNSAFGDDLGLQAYPKASLSYVISEEQWWPAALGDVKLRGALGWSGRAPGAFDKEKLWTATAYAGDNAFLPANVGNSLIGPERTRELEFGMDGAFIDGRLAAEFTWYHQQTSDALFDVSRAPSEGFLSAVLANVGTIRNTGIEAAVDVTIIDRANWGFDVGTSVYTSHSLVVDLGGATPFQSNPSDGVFGLGDGGGGGWVEEGFPVLAAKGIKIKNADAIADPETDCGAGDPCAIDGDWVFGPMQPTVIWGINGTVRFPKGISLSARGEYQGGAYIQDGASFNALSRSVLWPLCGDVLNLTSGDIIKPEEQWTARQRIECNLPLRDLRYMWFSQDFFKIRDITLTVPFGFLIPQANSATLSFTLQNAVRWINGDLRMFDPEMTARESISDQNREISEHIPPPMIFTASLRVTF